MQVILANEKTASIVIDKSTNRVKAYPNSDRGRAQIEEECSPEIVQRVYAVWGKTPTVTETKTEYPALVAVPSPQDIINANIMARLATLEGVSNV